MLIFSYIFGVLVYNPPQKRRENKHSFIHMPLETVSIKVGPVGSGGNRKYDLTLRGWGGITDSNGCRAKYKKGCFSGFELGGVKQFVHSCHFLC